MMCDDVFGNCTAESTVSRGLELAMLVEFDGEMEDFALANGSMDTVPDGKEVTTYLVTMIFIAIFIVGVCGNFVLILTVVRNLSMQNPPNIFLANMAVGDLLVILISVPFASTIYVTNSWPFGLILCKFNASLQVISIGVSIFTLLILSVDRYTAIVTPFKLHNKRQTRGCSLTIRLKIISIWLVSIAFSVPDALNTTLEEIHAPNNVTYQTCSPYPEFLGNEYHIGLVLGKFMVYFVIPVLLISVVYGLMARQLIFSTDLVPARAQASQQQLQKQMQNRKSLARLFLVMALLFVVCFLPKHIFLIWFYGNWPNSMDHYNLGWHLFKLTSHCLAYVNSCINPVTLYFLSKVFRKYFDRYLFRKCSRKAGDTEWSLQLRRNSQTLTSMPSLSGFVADDRRRTSAGSSSAYSINPKETICRSRASPVYL